MICHDIQNELNIITHALEYYIDNDDQCMHSMSSLDVGKYPNSIRCSPVVSPTIDPLIILQSPHKTESVRANLDIDVFTKTKKIGYLCNACDNVSRLVNDIKYIDLTKKLTMHNEDDINIRDYVSEIVDYCNDFHNIKKDVHIIFICAYNDHIVRIDKHRLRQLLINFISNSVKYTDTGYIKVDITHITTNIGVSRIHFEITDTGCGISQDDILKLHSGTCYSVLPKHNKPGSGLGVAISTHIIKQMNGSIQITSDNKTYTKIKFNIIAKLIEQIDLPINCSNAIKPITYTHYNILIIDDSEINCVMLQQVINNVLRDYDIICNYATTYSKFIKMFNDVNIQYNIIFVDMLMPHKNGIEIVHYIRKIEQNMQLNACCVIGVSGDADYKQSALQAGMDKYLTKPIKKADLIKIFKCTY